MALPNPAPGDSVAADDIDQIRNHLEGGSGKTAPYKLRQSAGDFIVVLADAAGASELSIHDSADVEVAHIDSDGNATFTTTTFTNLDIPVSASPAQTTEGRVVWDSDDDRITVGDGTARKIFSDDAKRGLVWVASDTTERTTTSTSVVSLSSFTGLSIAAAVPIIIRGVLRKTAGAANAPQINLTMNGGSSLFAANSAFSATNQAEHGSFEFYIPPRVTNYTSAARMRSVTKLATASAWGTNQDIGGATAAPTATITDIVVQGNAVDALITLAIDEVHVYTLGTNT